MTKEYTGPKFRPIFNAAMAAWWAGNCKGVCPMENWDCTTSSGKWDTGYVDGKPDYVPKTRYRFKPAPKRMVKIGYLDINGDWQQKELVAPETVAPEIGSPFFYIDSAQAAFKWDGNKSQQKCLNNGELFLTYADAQAMSDWQAKCRGGGA